MKDSLAALQSAAAEEQAEDPRYPAWLNSTIKRHIDTKDAKNPLEWVEISSRFGKSFIFGAFKPHNGVDIPVDKGTPVYATMAGTVHIKNEPGGYGNYIVIVGDGGQELSLYGHLSTQHLLADGTKVKKGDLIALSGHTGRSTGPHLHYGYATRRNNTHPSPIDYSHCEISINGDIVTVTGPSTAKNDTVSQRFTFVNPLEFGGLQQNYIPTREAITVTEIGPLPQFPSLEVAAFLPPPIPYPNGSSPGLNGGRGKAAR